MHHVFVKTFDPFTFPKRKAIFRKAGFFCDYKLLIKKTLSSSYIVIIKWRRCSFGRKIYKSLSIKGKLEVRRRNGSFWKGGAL